MIDAVLLSNARSAAHSPNDVSRFEHLFISHRRPKFSKPLR